MNFQFYFERLKNSEVFKKFIEENPSAFLCSGFFSIDKIGEDNKQHFDYFNNSKIFSFQVENNCSVSELENIGGQILSQVSCDYDFEFNKIEKMIFDKMQEEGNKKDVQKILLSLQNVNGIDYLIGTIFISGLGMLKVKIDLSEMKIIEFEKKSFFDMVKVLKK